MRSLILVCFIIPFLNACSQPTQDSTDNSYVGTMMTFNIRNFKNSAKDDGINNWENRKALAADVFRQNNIDIAGLQEAYLSQITYLEQELPEYSWTGIGRDDGLEKGEYSPIFYRTEVFNLLDSGTFWLSETPEEICSIGWDADMCRIATWGKFQIKKTGKIFVFINTHFDHIGVVARSESAKLLMTRAKDIVGNNPSIIVGDFNFMPHMKGYATMTAPQGEKPGYRDTRKVSATYNSTAQYTYHAYGNNELGELVDFIFVNDQVESLSYTTYEKTVDNIYVSDHYPVISTLRLAFKF